MAPTFTKIQPSLPVSSILDSIKYYTEILGFRVSGRDRDDHTWLRLGGEDEDKYTMPVNIYLRRRGFPDIANDVAFGKVHIRVTGAEDELEKLFDTYVAKGAKVLEKVAAMPWGLKHFTVTDLDGNILNFDQAIAGWKPPVRRDG
ncbi:Putative glyoxalase/Bleomycin resistance protein/Dihydroxybiphenyl dioxygenase [Septoria linicola]|uniref:Glyoxalase/Bleomycin resistance protein/Dihydroxybiphenyl dioxygenase n=1 Tax=Septoria linicola TaxID=215465 RepID=A0A9Q9EJZ1_9PEZI|nr:putative glyoxalase/Bleomycin resistance protein/Dihydroxybiphenyl dioxygenase [Septoria linicola]USW51873.1 Putative glyoxalase/Bleomycin resistance protein/Dihydroxybiphenyl dioxygenase [Septoria linicola]